MCTSDKLNINYLLNENEHNTTSNRTSDDFIAANHLFHFQQSNSIISQVQKEDVIAPSEPKKISDSSETKSTKRKMLSGTVFSPLLLEESENPGVCYHSVKKVSNIAPYHEGDVFLALRVQAYCNLLRNSTQDKEQRFSCPFDANCEKRVKGKGNLRRHIEWHLQKLEEDYKESMGTKWSNSMPNGVKSEWQLIKDRIPPKFHY